MSVLTIASHAYDAALALVYPRACAVCGASVESRRDGVACADCWDATRVFAKEDIVCWKCGALTQAQVSEDQRARVSCRQCDQELFTAARACGFYEGALRASVLALKRDPEIPERLVQLMMAAQQWTPINQTTLIVPVPLHRERERERGFNQAGELGRRLARLRGLPFDGGAVVRQTHTERHRGGMDAQARKESVSGAFRVRNAAAVVGQRILLVDDVFTTGATVSACAALLKESGAAEVFVLTVARRRTF